jgi:hypothetical protein
MEFRAHITGYMRTVYRCIPPTYCPAKFQMVVVVYVPPPYESSHSFFCGGAAVHGRKLFVNINGESPAYMLDVQFVGIIIIYLSTHHCAEYNTTTRGRHAQANMM